VFNFFTAISCGAGTYLPLGASTCSICPSGTYSLGGGHRIQLWNQWPREIVFDTYCTDTASNRLATSTCSGWSLNSSFTESHNNGKSNTRSVLVTTVHLYQDGHLTFTAKVDGELHYDQLYLFIDATPSIGRLGTIQSGTGVAEIIPNSQTPVAYTYNLTAGFHTIYWIYSKDATMNIGSDRAYIYSVEITAMSMHNDYCTECIPGWFSEASDTTGATSCSICPRNTFSNTTGSSSCLSCAEDSFSYPGDTNCTARLRMIILVVFSFST
jgi:hypothetical protein